MAANSHRPKSSHSSQAGTGGLVQQPKGEIGAWRNTLTRRL